VYFFCKPISRRARRDFASLLRRPKSRYRFQLNLKIPSILAQVNKINSTTHSVSEIQFNIIPYLKFIHLNNTVIIISTYYTKTTYIHLFPSRESNIAAGHNLNMNPHRNKNLKPHVQFKSLTLPTRLIPPPHIYIHTRGDY
jgi:hypothetical protein